MQNAKRERKEKRQWLDLWMLSNSQAQADCCSVVAIATVAAVAAIAAIATVATISVATVAAIAAVAAVVGRLGGVASVVVDGLLHNSADDGSPGLGGRGRVVIATLINDDQARSRGARTVLLVAAGRHIEVEEGSLGGQGHDAGQDSGLEHYDSLNCIKLHSEPAPFILSAQLNSL